MLHHKGLKEKNDMLLYKGLIVNEEEEDIFVSIHFFSGC